MDVRPRLLTRVASVLVVAAVLGWVVTLGGAASFALSSTTFGPDGQVMVDTAQQAIDQGVTITEGLFPLFGGVADSVSLSSVAMQQAAKAVSQCSADITGGNGFPPWGSPDFSGTGSWQWAAADPWGSACDPLVVFPSLYTAQVVAQEPWVGRFCAAIEVWDGGGYFPPASASSLPGTSWAWIDQTDPAMNLKPWQLPVSQDGQQVMQSAQMLLDWLNEACPPSWLSTVYGSNYPVAGSTAPAAQPTTATQSGADANGWYGYCDVKAYQGQFGVSGGNQWGLVQEAMTCNVSSVLAADLGSPPNQQEPPMYLQDIPTVGGGTLNMESGSGSSDYVGYTYSCGSGQPWAFPSTFSYTSPGTQVLSFYDCIEVHGPITGTNPPNVESVTNETTGTAGSAPAAYLCIPANGVCVFYPLRVDNLTPWSAPNGSDTAMPAQPQNYFTGGSGGAAPAVQPVQETSPATTVAPPTAPAPSATVPTSLPSAPPATDVPGTAPALQTGVTQVQDPLDFGALFSELARGFNAVVDSILYETRVLAGDLVSLSSDIGSDFEWLWNLMSVPLYDIVGLLGGLVSGIMTGLANAFEPAPALLESQLSQLQASFQSSGIGQALTVAQSLYNSFVGAVNGQLSGGSDCGPSIDSPQVVQPGIANGTAKAAPSYTFPAFNFNAPNPDTACPGNGYDPVTLAQTGTQTTYDQQAANLFGYRTLIRGLMEFGLMWWFLWSVAGWAPWAKKSAQAFPLGSNTPVDGASPGSLNEHQEAELAQFKGQLRDFHRVPARWRR